MGTDHLFKLIRQEDCALWIGAGFSLYAGYPGGAELRNLIFKELSTEEQNQLRLEDSLKKISQSLVTFRNGSRNQLNTLLQRTYGRRPTATHNHDLLSRIPHFKDIITTNYDSLLEDSFTRRAHVVRNDSDVAYITNDQPTIYKPHGDLIAFDKIIITANDYAQFYTMNRNTPFWSSLLSILSRKTLVFLGYGFEDDNIWPWFDLINETIGTNRKERYLIAPGWIDLKIRELRERNIEYIDMTGDVFLSELDIHLQEHIVKDFEDKVVSQDTVNKYFELRDYNSTISNFSGKPIITSLNKPGSMVTSTLTMQIDDQKTAKKIIDFQNGIGKELDIDLKHLLKFEHFTDNFKMNMSADKLASLKITRPAIKQKLTVEFPDEDLEIADVVFESYFKNKKTMIIEAQIYGFELKFMMRLGAVGSSIDVSFKLPKKLPAIQKCVNYYKAIYLFGQGKRMVFHLNGTSLTNQVVPVHMNRDSIKNNLQIFENLRKIEKFFNVRFENKEWHFKESTVNAITNLAHLIDDGYYKLNLPKGLLLTRKQAFSHIPITPLPVDVGDIIMRGEKDQKINLLDIELELGESGVFIQQPEYFDISNNGLEAKARSKNNVYRQVYSRFTSFDDLKDIEDDVS